MVEIAIENYSEKSFAVFGNTKTFKDELKKLGGKFNSNLKGKAGWIFSNSNKTKVEEFISGCRDVKKEILDEHDNNQINLLSTLQTIIYDNEIVDTDKIERIKLMIDSKEYNIKDKNTLEKVYDNISKNIEKHFDIEL